MSVAAKVFLLLLRNKKVRNTIISVCVGTVLIILMCLPQCGANFWQGRSSALAEQANAEYNYWQNAAPSDSGLSCQGERYCSHFSSSVVDWCCYFVGFCADNARLNLEDIGFAPNCDDWINNLSTMNKLKNAGEYSPQVGNLVFFNYSGRSAYAATHSVSHIGIVVAVSNNDITIIAGNEYRGNTSNWANVSYVNKYTLTLDNDTIACYGAVGSDSAVSSNTLNTVTRDVICHNEVGVMYSDVSSEYGSVIANDNGALSIGVYGWHGNNALSLMQRAYEINPLQVTEVVRPYYSSYTILSAITGKSADWSTYIPDVDASACIKSIILTDAGKQAQDETSLADAQEYIDICQQHGLTDNKAIIYCSDILNQWGKYSFDGGVLSGITSTMTVDDIYNSQCAWSDSNYNYRSRRTWTYDYIKNL